MICGKELGHVLKTNRKGSTRFILSMDQYGAGNGNINQSFIDSFVHSKTM